MQRGVDLTRHQEQARTLNPEPYVDLYEVRVNPSAVVRLTNHPNVSWAGSEWVGEGVASGGKRIRICYHPERGLWVEGCG